ncbi:BCL-6 corepressor-like protein 1 isoform X2 [Spea bombifrons]|uniref:BCL-6 corepressor-like protein 1 isoform X2 n=1 Tax=Spea bombifrons TaxID=233779 RepID=UPI00234BC1C8|nr:BCL-6 corepressor-like protein 1 isoform X2 [Spea bombifrons]
MISAAPLYSGVHNWTSADHVRMCGINEDRRTPLSDEESKASSSQHLGSEDRCVSSVLSKVDFIPATNQSDALMLREDGGAEVEAVQKLEEKPPDPTIFVSDSVDTPAVTPENCIGISVPEKKQLANMLDISVQGASNADSKIMESARTPAPEKAAEADPTFQPADGDHSVKQRTVLTADLQIAGQPVEASRTVVTSSFGTLTPFTMSGICFSATQVPSVQKLPLSFPPGAVLTPTQPLVYIPPPNCGQSLSVTTLPTTFGVTSTLTLPMLQSCLQDRCLPSIITPTELHSQAFASSVARPIAVDSKSTELTKPTSTTSSTPPTNNSITTSVDVTAISSNASSSVLSSHPTLPVVINPVTLASYTRTSSNLESQSDAASSSISPLKSPPQLEREIVSPQDSCDMPLDLSSKSHRQKHTPPNQRKTPPMPVLTPVHTSGKASLSTVLSRSDCSSQRSIQNSFTSSSVTQNIRAVPPLVMFPEFLRNGDPGSAQLLGAPGSWIKNSAAFISTIPGTYVGVANPVPASMLLNKDSNMSLSKDSRHLAKQEPISIIDQGDPKNSGSCSKKGTQTSVDVQQPTANRYLQGHVTSVTSLCPPKDWSLRGHGSVHPKCPLNGKPSNAQVLPVSWSPYQQASLLSIGISATGTLHSNQAPPHRLPIGEYTLFPNILPAEPTATPQKTVGETPDAQQKNTVASVPEHDLVAKGRTCETVSKSRKSNANKALLAPKPAAGNSVLYIQPAEPAESGKDSIKGANATLKSPDKANCKEEKIHPKFPCPRKSFGDSKPKNKVLATYMTNEQPLVSQQKDCLSLLDQNCSKNGSRLDVPQDTSACSKKSRKKGQNVDSQHCVQEVDLSKVKIERVDDDENFGCISSYENPPWSPVDLPAISKVKTRIKKEPGLRCRSKRLEEVSTITPLPQRSKSRTKQRDEDVTKASQEPNRRKWRRQAKITEAVPEKKVGKITATEKESNRIRPKRKRRKSIKHEPFDPEFDRDIPEKKPKNSFRDFIPVVLKSRTRSQKGNVGSSDNMAACPGVFSEEEEMEVPCKRRKPRNIYKDCPYRKYTLPKEEPQSMPITPVLRGSWELSNRVKDTGKPWAPLAVEDEKNEDGSLVRRKRRRQKNRKYQNGEYLTEKEEEEVSQCYRRRKARSDFRKRKSSLSDRDIDLKNKLPPSSRESQKQGESRNGLNKSSPDESPTSMTQDKPSGKRKCKTKHIGGSTDEDAKGKVRRTSQSPKSSPVKSPSSRKCADPVTPQRSRRTSTLGSSDTPSAQHIPPEARRLIVNKNAGETLLQRAARLGYKDVVLYCLQRDLGDINHRDNAGYTALHEACARGWTEILQILLDNGANVNCSAQDGTRPIHDAVVNDNLETVWLLLSYGADPTLATYSGQTPMKLASSEVMRTYLSDYLSDLRGRSDGDPRAAWDFYSSSILGGKDEIGHDVLLDSSEKNEEEEGDKDLEDNFMFEFSDKPLISCYNLHVSLTSGPGNWFLFSEVLKKLKLSSRIFQARYPKFEIASMQKKEFTRQVCTSQILTASEGMDLWPQDVGEMVELVRYEPELLQLLGSSVEFQCVNS